MPRARSCCCPSTATPHRKALPLQALSAIRPSRAVHGIRRAITSRSSWRRECRPQAQSSAATAASGTFIYYQGEVKQLVESTHTEVRDERSFTLLEDVNCPAVLAEQCFVTSEEDVAQFGSEEGCKTVARAYYEAICAYFGTQPLDTPL